MTTSRRSGPRGRQKPRVEHVPRAADFSAGEECIALAASAGLHLDPWQQHVIRGALGERADGNWQAFEVGLIVPRQNGKGAIIEALELYWLFVCDEDRLILHSAHEFKTAREGFLRIRGLIERTPELNEQVRQFYASTGGECGIELEDGKRLRFVARSTGAGRGFSPDKLVLDEAYNLPDAAIEAVLPSVGARPNPQVWYTSSPGDYTIAPCDQLARVRRRGVKGEDQALAYFEWSAPYDDVTGTLEGDPADPATWAWANPSLGIRKTAERVANFQASMSAKGFAREELGVGTWPAEESAEDAVIDLKAWAALADKGAPAPSGSVALVIDVSPDRKSSSIAIASAVGEQTLVLVESAAGVKWVVPRVAALVAERSVSEVALHPSSQAGALIPQLIEAGVEHVAMTTQQMGAACAAFIEGVSTGRLVHVGQPELDAAVANARTRFSGAGETELWDRRKRDIDISPLVAASAAAYRWGLLGGPEYDVLDSIY